MVSPYHERMICYYGEADVWRARHAEACRAYAAGEVTSSVFLAVLFGLGFRGQELMAEERLNRTERSVT